MNAVELFKGDGKPAGVFYCGKCRIVKRTQEEAEQCCQVPICACGAEIKEKYYTDCHKCRQVRFQIECEKKEKERFEKATKIPEADYDGPVYCEAIGWNDGYFRDTGELHEYATDEDLLREDQELEDDETPIPATPPYAWACHVNPICHLDLASILENACPEDWETDRLEGTEELQKALDAFNERNKGEVSWTPDYKRAILLETKTPPRQDTP